MKMVKFFGRILIWFFSSSRGGSETSGLWLLSALWAPSGQSVWTPRLWIKHADAVFLHTLRLLKLLPSFALDEDPRMFYSWASWRDVVAMYKFDKGWYSYNESEMTHNFINGSVLLLGAAGFAGYHNLMKLG